MIEITVIYTSQNLKESPSQHIDPHSLTRASCVKQQRHSAQSSLQQASAVHQVLLTAKPTQSMYLAASELLQQARSTNIFARPRSNRHGLPSTIPPRVAQSQTPDQSRPPPQKSTHPRRAAVGYRSLCCRLGLHSRQQASCWAGGQLGQGCAERREEHGHEIGQILGAESVQPSAWTLHDRGLRRCFLSGLTEYPLGSKAEVGQCPVHGGMRW